LMSGDGKRGVGHRPQATAPIVDSTMADVGKPLAVRPPPLRDAIREKRIAKQLFVSYFPSCVDIRIALRTLRGFIQHLSN
jgi:hypothetical protein